MNKIRIIVLTMLIFIFTGCGDKRIIGEWYTTDRSAIVKKVEFTEDKCISLGMHIECSYEYDGDKVIVTDFTGIGIEWFIIDENRIATRDLLTGRKIVFNRK